MSNYLLEGLPTTDRFGREIKTGFKTWIAFESMWQDPLNLIDEDDTMRRSVSLVYKSEPSDYRVAFDELRAFNDMYIEREEVLIKPPTECIFDWKHDIMSVYGAFRRTYGIDLFECDNMHWWKFKTLFNELDPDTYIVRAMYYRGEEFLDEKDSKYRNKKLKEKQKYLIR